MLNTYCASEQENMFEMYLKNYNATLVAMLRK